MEIVAILLALILLGGALGWDTYSQRRHVARLGAAWMRDGTTIMAGPVGVIAHCPARGESYRILGALGAAGDQVIFAGQRVKDEDFAAPVDSIRWIGLRTNVKASWNRRIERREFIIHREDTAGWHSHVFSDGGVEICARQLAEASGLTLHDVGDRREDFGPDSVIALTQDAAGVWHPGADEAPRQGAHEDLYLAPECLVIGWRDTIQLDRIRRIDAYARERSFDGPLLRLELDEDGARRVVGFLLDDVGDWAGLLETRTDAPVTHHK
jgi:hypothetical protein